ncbi:hypothetical protein BGW37DRAFT_182862 [Umbelopsis sp. PMI_123]|nr:hypothetical protein BGW37DRAFT_182862 [Umbelopsis sp. PMI_123]
MDIHQPNQLLPFQNEEQPLPTFRTNEQSSIIVYIFCHPDLETYVTNPKNHVIPKRLSDHSMLSVAISMPNLRMGPGTWRFNPMILNQKEFILLLQEKINSSHSMRIY